MSVPVVSLLIAFLVCSAHGEVYVHRQYEDEASVKDWVRSEKKPETAGTIELKSMKLLEDESKKSLYTAQPGKFYHYSLPVGKAVSNVGKDLVFQFALTHEDGVTCGGGYLKLLTENDPKNFDGETPYAIMFGPDVCGTSGRVHVIFNIGGKNVLKTEDIPYAADKLTHVYTLVVNADRSYAVYKDCEEVDKGLVSEKWNYELPKEIKDPADKKPADWVDSEMMDDPTDKKPEDHDQPEFIDDPDATKPEEWDDETDGQYVPSKIKNPEFKGTWKPKQIKNPDYKGAWVQKKIPNPDYKQVTDYAQYDNIVAIGYDIWMVDAKSHLSHVMLADDPQAALAECKSLLPAFAVYNKKVEEIVKKENEKYEQEMKETREKEEAKAKEDDDDDDEDIEMPKKKDEKDEL